MAYIARTKVRHGRHVSRWLSTAADGETDSAGRQQLGHIDQPTVASVGHNAYVHHEAHRVHGG
jgi:hypothetical protein